MSTSTDTARAAELAWVFKTPFAEQVAFFRGKLGQLVPTATWSDLWQSQHDQAFMVAGAAKADLLADLAAAVERAIADGETLAQFRARFKGIVQQHGWHGWTGEGSKAGVAWRTRMIYDTNLLTSYSAGRLAQLRQAGYSHWMYKHSDSAHPRPHHQAWDGVVRPANDACWLTHYPPNGWGCRCRVVGVDSPAAAKRLGGDWDKPLPPGWDQPDPKTGAPVGIDKGFGYMPGGSVQGLPAAAGAVADKLPKLPAALGAALGADLSSAALNAAYGAFFDEALAQRARPQGKSMVVGALRPAWISRLQAAGQSPYSAEIVVRDHDLAHALRDTKEARLPPAWWRELPTHLRNPQAVILDVTHKEGAALLLVFDAPQATKKVVVRLNYRLKRLGMLNRVTTGHTLEVESIQGNLGKGYTLIEGQL